MFSVCLVLLSSTRTVRYPPIFGHKNTQRIAIFEFGNYFLYRNFFPWIFSCFSFVLFFNSDVLIWFIEQSNAHTHTYTEQLYFWRICRAHHQFPLMYVSTVVVTNCHERGRLCVCMHVWIVWWRNYGQCLWLRIRHWETHWWLMIEVYGVCVWFLNAMTGFNLGYFICWLF